MKFDAFLKLSGMSAQRAYLRDVFRVRSGKVVRIENLKVTPKRTAEQIRQAIREGHVAEMSPNEAGA